MLTYKSKREMLPFKCGLCSLVDTKGHCRQLGWSFLQEHQAGPLELSSGEATHCESCLHLTHMLPFCNACCRSFVFSTNMALLLSTHRTPAHTMLPDYPFQLISAVFNSICSLFPPLSPSRHCRTSMQFGCLTDSSPQSSQMQQNPSLAVQEPQVPIIN